MRLCLLPLALGGLLTASAVPAHADDNGLHAKISAAMRATTSFVVSTTVAGGYSVSMTFVAPDRYHSVLLYGSTSREVVLIGPVAYLSADGGHSYRKIDTPPEVLASAAQLRDVPIDDVLPDKAAGNTTWGQFATSSAGPQKDQHMTCTYDKKTFRMNECRNEAVSLTFSRYDDPANVVTVPTNVTTPAPAAAKPGAPN